MLRHWQLVAELEDLFKAKAHPVGHRSKRKDGWYVKQHDGTWQKERPDGQPAKPRAKRRSRKQREEEEAREAFIAEAAQRRSTSTHPEDVFEVTRDNMRSASAPGYLRWLNAHGQAPSAEAIDERERRVRGALENLRERKEASIARYPKNKQRQARNDYEVMHRFEAYMTDAGRMELEALARLRQRA